MINDNQLEYDLASLTRWDGPATALWSQALSAREHAAAPVGNAPARRLRVRLPVAWMSLRSPRWLVGVAAAAMAIALVPILQSTGRIPEYSTVNELSRKPAASPPSTLKSLGDRSETLPSRDSLGVYSGGEAQGGRGGGRFGASGARPGDSAAEAGGFAAEGMFAASRDPSSISSQGSASSVSADRHVVRKATIELRVADVRAAYRKASLLISEASGEYVQESSLAGVAPQLQADLTLRVSAERLSAVLAALRELGEVYSEVAGGEDVTTQVVDLEARLRNERRVEAELLELLENRTDAPLREVLELRQAIAGVRQSIESMAGQRERLARLVSLATVLVVIRAADAPAPQTPGLGSYFLELMRSATTRGARTLIETFAGLIYLLIGGALWIGGLLAAVIVVWRCWRTAVKP